MGDGVTVQVGRGVRVGVGGSVVGWAGVASGVRVAAWRGGVAANAASVGIPAFTGRQATAPTTLMRHSSHKEDENKPVDFKSYFFSSRLPGGRTGGFLL